jgi:hypothetical protein
MSQPRSKPCPECKTVTCEHEAGCEYGKLEGHLLHTLGKLSVVLGINEQEQQWVRDCGVKVGE